MIAWSDEYCPPTRRWQRLICALLGHRPFQETAVTIYCLRCWRVGKVKR